MHMTSNNKHTFRFGSATWAMMQQNKAESAARNIDIDAALAWMVAFAAQSQASSSKTKLTNTMAPYGSDSDSNSDNEEDERMKACGPDSMPFDGKRMIFGGFETIEGSEPWKQSR